MPRLKVVPVPQEVLMGYKQVASFLNVSERHFRRLRQHRDFPVRFLGDGTTPFVLIDELRAYLKACPGPSQESVTQRHP